MNKYDFESVYSDQQTENIAKEFKRAQGLNYLDNVGCALYSEKQLENVLSDLQSSVYANPHTRNATNSKTTEEAIDIVRYRILDHFKTTPDEYSVVFTSGTTAALKLVAETFQFGKDGYLAYLETNHTSVLGMRAYAPNIKPVEFETAFELLSESNNNQNKLFESNTSENNNLFVFPAMCNFAGTKYPLQWIESSQNGQLNELIDENNKTTYQKNNWYVLLDAPTFIGTNNLNLEEIKPDFVTLSFYKLFGYPTGLGALLVRKSAEKVLVKSYLGGGTVLMALSKENIMIPRPGFHERFEDGTLPFLSILALKHGFDTLERLGLNMRLISWHTFNLARYFYKNLQRLHHGTTKKPVAVFYNDTAFEKVEFQGGIVNFNLLRDNGEFVGYSEVLHLTNLHGIQLRTGCFCNQGACQRFLKLSTDDVKRQYEAGHVCGDQHDLVDGYPTGSVRISFGYMSKKEDADALLNLIESSFVSKPIIRKVPDSFQFNSALNKYEKMFHSNNAPEKIELRRKIEQKEVLNFEPKSKILNHSLINSNFGAKVQGVLKKIFLYPVKSCGAFLVKSSWPISATGLKFDRQWMIVNSSGVCVTQKQVRNLCLLRPEVDLNKNTLTLNFPDWKPMQISLITEKPESQAQFCNSKICGDKIQGYDCGDAVANWLEDALSVSGLRLLQLPDPSTSSIGRSNKKLNNNNNNYKTSLSLVNKAQYLMINKASVEWLRSKIPEEEIVDDVDGIVDRFRCNFLVDFQEEFVENSLEQFEIDGFKFQSGGKCTRCQMICINQSTGKTSKEPLATLAREFKGSIAFGLYLNQINNDNIGKNEIFINSTVIATKF